MRRLLWYALVVGLPAGALHAQDFKAYQNYDFIPGDKILFEDDFRSDQDGEFPAHWKLTSGQGVVNLFQGEPAFLLTEGNYVKVAQEQRQRVAPFPGLPQERGRGPDDLVRLRDGDHGASPRAVGDVSRRRERFRQ